MLKGSCCDVYIICTDTLRCKLGQCDFSPNTFANVEIYVKVLSTDRNLILKTEVFVR